MTLTQLIERLVWLSDQYGPDCRVKVVDGKAEWPFTLTPHGVNDPQSETGAGVEILIDITPRPEK